MFRVGKKGMHERGSNSSKSFIKVSFSQKIRLVMNKWANWWQEKIFQYANPYRVLCYYDNTNYLYDQERPKFFSVIPFSFFYRIMAL